MKAYLQFLCLLYLELNIRKRNYKKMKMHKKLKGAVTETTNLMGDTEKNACQLSKRVKNKRAGTIK